MKLEAESEITLLESRLELVVRLSPTFKEVHFGLYHFSETKVLVHIDRKGLDSILQFLCEPITLSDCSVLVNSALNQFFPVGWVNAVCNIYLLGDITESINNHFSLVCDEPFCKRSVLFHELFISDFFIG